MAIALDASSGVTRTLASTSHTLSHICGSGANRILIAGVVVNNPNTDIVTGVTYNGVAMTQAKKLTLTTLAGFGYIYYLVNPASGANDIVVSTSGSADIYCGAISYTGAKQTGQPDATGEDYQGSGDPITNAVTTIEDNCWMFSVGFNDDGTTTVAGTGTTLRGSQLVGRAVGDSNGPITPAGSYTMGWSDGNASNRKAMLQMSFSPAPDAEGGFFYMSV